MGLFVRVQSEKVCNGLYRNPALTNIFQSSLAARLGTVPRSSGWYQYVLSPIFQWLLLFVLVFFLVGSPPPPLLSSLPLPPPLLFSPTPNSLFAQRRSKKQITTTGPGSLLLTDPLVVTVAPRVLPPLALCVDVSP